MSRWIQGALAWLACLLLVAPVRAETPVVAVVVEVKGEVVKKVVTDPPQRKGTLMRLLTTVNEGQQVSVPDGGRLVLSFTQGGVRATVTGPAEGVVRRDRIESKDAAHITLTTPSNKQAKLAPLGSMDFSRMGGASARGLCNMVTDVARPRLSLQLVMAEHGSELAPALVPGKSVALFYSQVDENGPWTPGTATVGPDQAYVVPDFDLKPGHKYDLRLLNKPADSNAKIDFTVYTMTPADVAPLAEAVKEADAPGEDRLARQITLIRIYYEKGLFDRALARTEELLKASPDDNSLTYLLGYLKEQKPEVEKGLGAP